jgi:hypothetical protein
MNELDKIASTFGQSEPVFVITSEDSSHSELRFTVKNKYEPSLTDDPLYNLIAGTFSEYLDKGRKRFEGSVSTDRAYASLIQYIRATILNYSPLKNPKQSKLYKWLGEYNPAYKDSSEGFIALYRYIVNSGIGDTRDHTNPHAKNVIAILELMKEKA